MTKINTTLICAIAITVSAAGGSTIAAPTLPDFGAATFELGQPVDNMYFPLTEGLIRTFTGERIDGNATILERFELETLGPGPTILGVQTTAQRDRAFENNVLVEDTLDYYAQDTAGNVWYFGEEVTNILFDSMGNPAGTDSVGTWRAGVNNGLPGFIMPADLSIGFNYYQEFAPNDGAVDQATTISVGEMVTTELGTFSNVLKVLETSELNPEFRELKYYAPGRGLVFVEEGVNADLMDPAFTIELTRITTDKDGDEDDEDEEEDDDNTSMDDTDDDSHDDRGMNRDHETNNMDDMEQDDMESDDESNETGDDSNADDETPSALRVSKLARLFSARSAVTYVLSRDVDLASQIIDQALTASDSKVRAAALEEPDGGLLASMTVRESSELNFHAAFMVDAGASLSVNMRAQSPVPEPPASLLIVLASLAACGRRSRVRSPQRP